MKEAFEKSLFFYSASFFFHFFFVSLQITFIRINRIKKCEK